MMQPMLFSWLYFTLVSLQSPVRNFSPGIPQMSDLVGTYSFGPSAGAKSSHSRNMMSCLLFITPYSTVCNPLTARAGA